MFLLSVTEHSMYTLCNDGLYALLFNQSKDQLLNNLILFAKPELATNLCVLNNWDKQALSIHVLHSGLRNRELDVIKAALASIDEVLEMRVCSMIAQFATTNVFPRGSEFKLLFAREGMSLINPLLQ